MKKSKEFLLLFVPLIVLTVSVVILLVLYKTNAFVSFSNGLALLFNDGVFLKAVLQVFYCDAIIFSVLAVIVVALLCRFIKLLKKRKVFYVLSIVLSSAVSFVSICINQVKYFGLPMSAYVDPKYTIYSYQPPISISAFEILLAVQIGFLTVLLVWLAERVLSILKAKNLHRR